MGCEPFEELLTRLGAVTAGYDFSQLEAGTAHDIRLDLTCTAPDEATANRLETAIKHYLSSPLLSDENPPPWQKDAENFEIAFTKSDLLHREHVERLIRNWDRYFNLGHNDFYRNRLRLGRLALERGAFRREGLQLVLEDIWFGDVSFALGLSALIAWLIVNDCTAIFPRFSAIKRKET